LFLFDAGWQAMDRTTQRAICFTLLMSAMCLAGAIACHDRTASLVEPEWVFGVVITPPSANLNVGDRLTFVASVFAGAGQRNRSVTWKSSNVAVATVNPSTGEVTALGGGTANIVATSVADTTVKATAALTVGSILIGPSISTISQDGKPAVLSNISGTIDVVVNLPGGLPSYSAVGLLLSCAGTDTMVATQTVATTASAQSITLSFNTAAYKNGPCTLKAKATTANGVIVFSSATPITLNNPSASATLLGAEYLRDPRFQRVELLSQLTP
jgi:hypothetical protein